MKCGVLNASRCKIRLRLTSTSATDSPSSKFINPTKPRTIEKRVTQKFPPVSQTSAMSAAKRRKVTASGPPVPVPVVKSKRDLIYDACMIAKPVGAEFTTAELLSFDNISIDEDSLGVLCQELLDRHLFSPWLQRGQSTMYRTRSKEDALKSVFRRPFTLRPVTDYHH
jgi:hypothetical protein